jgi:hypothetical protein
VDVRWSNLILTVELNLTAKQVSMRSGERCEYAVRRNQELAANRNMGMNFRQPKASQPASTIGTGKTSFLMCEKKKKKPDMSHPRRFRFALHIGDRPGHNQDRVPTTTAKTLLVTSNPATPVVRSASSESRLQCLSLPFQGQHRLHCSGP